MPSSSARALLVDRDMRAASDTQGQGSPVRGLTDTLFLIQKSSGYIIGYEYAATCAEKVVESGRVTADASDA
jgi:hypothetical protein